MCTLRLCRGSADSRRINYYSMRNESILHFPDGYVKQNIDGKMTGTFYFCRLFSIRAADFPLRFKTESASIFCLICAIVTLPVKRNSFPIPTGRN